MSDMSVIAVTTIVCEEGQSRGNRHISNSRACKTGLATLPANIETVCFEQCGRDCQYPRPAVKAVS